MIRLGFAAGEVAAQFASTGHSAGWHIVFLEVAGHHLPHRRVIVHNEDMARFLVSSPMLSPLRPGAGASEAHLSASVPAGLRCSDSHEAASCLSDRVRAAIATPRRSGHRARAIPDE